MLNQATITEICKYIDDRHTFFNFLNCCKYNQQFDYLFFDRYHICDYNFRDHAWKVIADPDYAHCLVKFLKKIRNLKSHSSFALEVIAKLSTNLSVIDISFCEQIPTLPSSLKRVTVLLNFCKFNVENIPDSVEILVLPKCARVIEKLPNSLIHLEIENFDTSIIKNFPPNLKTLLLGTYYSDKQTINTQCIDNIPDTIEVLRMTVYSNNNKVTRWPANLKHLTISGLVNQLLEYLPVGLKKLEIDSYFIQPTDKLPESVDTVMYSKYSCMPHIYLPNNVKTLILKNFYNWTKFTEISDTVEVIEIIGECEIVFKKFPSSLKRLKISRNNPILKDIKKTLDNDKIFFID